MSGTRQPSAAQLLEAWDAAHSAERAALAALLAALRPERTADPELYTLADAARRIGVSRSTVTRWADAGELATVRLDGRRWINCAELDRLAGAQR
jgi:excisionase family DNA binding protein